MTYTHPDQMAKTRDMETEGVMFPKGPKQMLGFIYAMEGEIARGASWHAKMMQIREMMDCGYLQPFSLYRINLSGLGAIEINGECSGLREQVESLLGESTERKAVWAKFGKDELDRTQKAVNDLAPMLREHMAQRRRSVQRSHAYCRDLLWSCVCAGVLYEKRFNVSDIARRHSMYQPTVWRDCDEAKYWLSKTLGGAYRTIEHKFRDGKVLA